MDTIPPFTRKRKAFENDNNDWNSVSKPCGSKKSMSSHCNENARGSTTKKPNTRSKNKITVPPGQPRFMNFVNDKQVSSMLISNANTQHSVKTKLPSKLKDGKVFLCLLGTSNDMIFITPFIIAVNEKDIPKKNESDELFVRFRVSHYSYAGKILLSSDDREAVESSLPSMIAPWMDSRLKHLIKHDQIVYSCTATVDLFPIDNNEPRVIWLKAVLRGKTNDDDDEDEHPMEQETIYDGPNPYDVDMDKSDNVEEILTCLANGGNEDSIDWSSKPMETSNFEIHDLSSDDQTNFAEQNKKKRRRRKFTDEKLVARLRSERAKSIEEANSDIIYAMDKLDEAIPTLTMTQPSTPIIKNLYKLIKALNSKMNCTQDRASFETSIPLTREIKVNTAYGTNQVRIDDKITLPLSGYSKAVANLPHRPCLIVSRIIRFCFPNDIKENCEVSDTPDSTNFLWRIGDQSLEGEDRVKDGRSIIATFTELAYKLMNETKMPFNAINESMVQVNKALYDLNRRIEMSKNQKIEPKVKSYV